MKRKRIDPLYTYYENHHIIPDCVGGTKDSFNMVLLTAREHFICHRLLVKMVEIDTKEWRKFNKAVGAFSLNKGDNNRKFTSHQYQIIKEHHIKAITGLKRDPAHVEKWSSKMKGRPLSEENIKNMMGKNKGKIAIHHPTSKDYKKISSDNIQDYLESGYVQGIPDHVLQKINKNGFRKGSKHSDESKRIQSEKRKDNIKNGISLKIFNESENPMNKKCTDGISIFKSISEMARCLKITRDIAVYRVDSDKDKWRHYKRL